MTNKTSIVKKHPDGYWCLYDSEGKRPLNCWDKRYKGKKPSDEVVQKAERTVQFWKHQGSTMDFEDMAGRLAAEKVGSAVSLSAFITVARNNFLSHLLDVTGQKAKSEWRATVVGSRVDMNGLPTGTISVKMRPKNMFNDIYVAFEYTLSSSDEISCAVLTSSDGKRWTRGNNGKQFRYTESVDRIVDRAIKIAEELLPSR